MSVNSGIIKLKHLKKTTQLTIYYDFICYFNSKQIDRHHLFEKYNVQQQTEILLEIVFRIQ